MVMVHASRYVILTVLISPLLARAKRSFSRLDYHFYPSGMTAEIIGAGRGEPNLTWDQNLGRFLIFSTCT
jgi:hypothetical protein